MEWLYLALLAYLIGSLPSAYLAGRIKAGLDIRSVGDGNPGAANSFRELGAIPGLLVGALDIGKGAGAVLAARQLMGTGAPELWAGVAVVAGHNWPIFLHLRGGRGAATALGVLMVVMPKAAIPLALLGIGPLVVTRSTTVALATILSPVGLVAWLTGSSLSYAAYGVMLPVLVAISHLLSVRRGPLPADGSKREQPAH